MANFAPSNIRNIALVGHGASGKTSIAEGLLFNAGANSRLGEAGTASSTFDFEPEEHARAGSIGSSFGWFEHDGHKINVIDTPGDGNFIFDSFTSMRGADTAVIVVSAVDGVEVQTERVFHHARDLGLPTIAIISKMDKERADWEGVLKDIEESFGVKPVPLQVPLGQEEAFSGVISLFQRKALTYAKDGSGTFEKGEVPEVLKETVDQAWEAIVECVAESDDDLLMEYLDSLELPDSKVREGFRVALKRGAILPVLFTAGPANIALHALCDLLVWAAPSPLERSAILATEGDELVEIQPSEDGPFYAQIVRTFMDEFSGKVSIFRVFSGALPADGQVSNTGSGEDERIGSTYALRGTAREQSQVVVGDILSVAKLKHARTNDTLSAEGTAVITPQAYPAPMMEYTLTVTSKGDEDKLKQALDRLIEEDPTLTSGYDSLSHKIVLKGMGQQHLDMSAQKMKRKFKVGVSVDLPAVPYRETIRKPVTNIEGKHKKQTGGSGQFGVCFLDVAPNPDGFEFVDKTFGGSIPKQYVPSVEKGVVNRMERGHVAGYPIVNLLVRLTDGKYHAVDSKDVAYQMAGSKGLSAALDKGGVKLLEPVYNLNIVVPTESMGDIMGDITSRRGRVMGMDPKGKNTIIQASAPLAEIQRYAPDLRSMTGGKGTFTMDFSGYEEVPSNLQAKVIAESPFRKDHDE
jgi:elongation factor G